MKILFYFFDSSSPWQLSFQDSASPVMEGMVNLHHDLMFFMIFICFFVGVVVLRTILFFSSSVNFTSYNVVHGTLMEILWTVIPSLILVVVALPSFALLYSIDEVINPSLTIKCMGHQWFWSYEYSDFELQSGSINFESYMMPEDDLNMGELRLLEVDNRVVLPVKSHISLLMTATDVLHSWAVPSLGIKVDACPGSLNQTSLFLLSDGVFYGQCSEICGVGHGNMPMVVESVSAEKYIAWLIEKL